MKAIIKREYSDFMAWLNEDITSPRYYKVIAWLVICYVVMAVFYR